MNSRGGGEGRRDGRLQVVSLQHQNQLSFTSASIITCDLLYLGEKTRGLRRQLGKGQKHSNQDDERITQTGKKRGNIRSVHGKKALE